MQLLSLGVRIALGTIVLAFGGLAQVSMIDQSEPIAGVTVIRYGDPEFPAALEKLTAGADLGAAAALLPYSVILRNDGPRKLLAVLRRYEVTRSDGTRQLITRRTEALASPSDALAVGAFILLSPMGGLGTASTNKVLLGSGMMGAEVQRWVPQLQSAQKIVFSVDSVVFEDGEIAGPDKSQYGREIEEVQRARRDLKASMPPEAGDLRAWLQSQIKSDVAGRATRNPDFYNLELGALAQSLLIDYDAVGPEEVRKRVSWLGSLPQSTIKRGEK